MLTRTRTTAVLVAATAAALAVVPLVPSSAVSPGPLLTVLPNVLPGLSHATDLGTVPGSTPMKLVVSVARPNDAGEKAYLAAVSNRSNSLYGEYLTPAQFASRFGVTASHQLAVKSYLTDGGLAVDSVSPAGDTYTVHGTAANVSSLFRTSIHNYSYTGGLFAANISAPVIKYGLGISNIVGLNTLQKYTTFKSSTPAQGSCTAGTCIGGTTPSDLWTSYAQGTVYTGQKQGVAMFGEGMTNDIIADLRLFETKFGLPTMPVTVKHPAGDTDFSDDSGADEWDIDTQASSGMAYNAKGLTMYFGTDLSDADIDKVFSLFYNDATGPKQASASYGECESIPVVSPIFGMPVLNPSAPAGQGLGNNNDATLGPIAQMGAVMGKTVFASTGDTGSSCPVAFAEIIGAGNGVANQVVPITNSPASLPYITAVGGTVLYTDGSGNRVNEYGWAFSGGGSTLFTPEPSYQVGTTNDNIPCVNAPTTICRGIPDVSAQSGDVVSNGYDIYIAGAYTEGGGAGTSLSAPLMQGMWARVQSSCKGTKGNGFANTQLYRVGNNAASYARDFFDESSTAPETSAPSSNGIYPALPGWDYQTGFGSPLLSGMYTDIGAVCSGKSS